MYKPSSKQSGNTQLSKPTQQKPPSQTKNKPSSTMEICAVCLNELDDNYAVLNCRHKFCSVQCAKGWWKFNQNCPYCRSQISFIQSAEGQMIHFDEISQQSESDDDNFIPRCAQCWADIGQDEEKKTCHNCSSCFIHKRCVMFNSRFWKCNSCIENVDENGRQNYPVIPYNPIIHFLMLKNFKE